MTRSLYTSCLKEEELKSAVLKEEIEKLHEEKSMLLETIEDLKQIVEQTEPKASTTQPFNIPSCGSRFDLQTLLLSGTHFNSCVFTGPGQVKGLALGDTKADLSSTPVVSALIARIKAVLFKFAHRV